MFKLLKKFKSISLIICLSLIFSTVSPYISYANNFALPVIKPALFLLPINIQGSFLISTATTGSINQPDVMLNYTYDKNNNRLNMTNSLGGTSNYVYDPLNRLTSISKGTDVFSFNYDNLNRRTSTSLPNGTMTSYTYDAANQLTNLTHNLGATSLANFTYTYDQTGNRTSMTTTRSGVSVNSPLNYIYDNLYRLTNATNPIPSMPDETFTYDSLGNRLQKQGQSTDASFNPSNRLMEDEAFTYIYDLNGNMVQKTNKISNVVTDYIYDAEDQLTEIKENTITIATYKYDGLGRRIEKIASGVTKRYIYDNEDILLEFDGANILQARYTHGAGIDEPLMMERSGVSHFYHADGLGSITDLTDSTGAVVQSYVYNSFGEIVSQIGTLENPYAYTGREYDSESGMYYYRARTYDPIIGRFLQEDPIGFLGGDLNLYVYVGNNPINLIDPFGLKGTFRENFQFSFRANNDFFFGGVTRFTRTAIGAATAGTVARSTGLRTAGMALGELLRNQRQFAPQLGMASAGVAAQLLGSVVANSAFNAAVVAGSIEAGVFVGSLLDAAIQTFLVDDEVNTSKETCEK